jgi:hypothetical protein|tara:strand:+ start:202 stop:591 length:390 start_codon:yes stop_codon:yes gene_type:complete
MQKTLSKILKLAGDLTKQELMMLNQAIVSLIKTQQDVDFKKAAIIFAKGDIVSFQDSSGVRAQGVITKKNPKTLQVTTPDNYYVNIPATFITLIKNPSQKLLDFKKRVAPTYEDMHEILVAEIEKSTLH